MGEQAHPLMGYVQPSAGVAPSVDQLLSLLTQLWLGVWRLWCQALLVSPFVALYIFSTRVKTAEDLERERLARLEARVKADVMRRRLLSAAPRPPSPPAATWCSACRSAAI